MEISVECWFFPYLPSYKYVLSRNHPAQAASPADTISMADSDLGSHMTLLISFTIISILIYFFSYKPRKTTESRGFVNMLLYYCCSEVQWLQLPITGYHFYHSFFQYPLVVGLIPDTTCACVSLFHIIVPVFYYAISLTQSIMTY